MKPMAQKGGIAGDRGTKKEKALGKDFQFAPSGGQEIRICAMAAVEKGKEILVK